MTAPGGKSQTSGDGHAAAVPDETLPVALQAVTAVTQDGVVLLDAQGLISDINAEARHMLNCWQPDMVGRDFWDVAPEPLAEQHEAATRKALASSSQHHFIAHSAFEGDRVDYTFIRHAAGYTVNLRDVNAASNMAELFESSERRNKLIFNANPNAMWVFDAVSLRILSANRAAVEFYGIPREIFLKLKMGALFPDGEGTALLSSMDPTKGAGDRGLRVEVCKQKKMDGQLVLVELACGHVRWNERNAFLVSLTDITERHVADRALRRENTEMQEQLERAHEELKKSRRDLEAFTYALSNDMQEPLHAVNGFAAILADKYAGALGEVGCHFLNRIRGSVNQLARLVDDLRVLVQLPPTAGDVRLVELAKVCSPLIAELRRRDPERLVTVEVETGVTLVADQALFAIALGCLLDNAWKFTGRKADGWIRVVLLPGKVPNETVLQVSDNGAGFDAAYTDKLFTAFQRLHSSADFPGNGLGLAIVKSVAERHSGRVWAETSPNGASFYMAFPQEGVAPSDQAG